MSISTRIRCVVAVGAVLLISACGNSDHDIAVQPPTRTAPITNEHQDVSVTIPGTLAADFAALQAGLPGKIGMAIMPVGGNRMITFGSWTSGPAWSTIKVPLVIAAARHNPPGPTYAATQAITASDNAAAETLWSGLGTGVEAAKAVETVLREGGDTVTTVPATRSRSDASAFGQAVWSLADQVRFASRLPCLQQSSIVTTLMEQVISSQRWGLGVLSGAEIKGGWGPDPSGAYLVRQFGLIPSPTGQLAIAFAAQPDSGSFNDGMAMLDRITALITAHRSELTGGVCPP